MVGHTVDSHPTHHLVIRIILVGLGVEITVGAAEGEVASLIAGREVDAIGLGILDVLILAHPLRVIAYDQVAGCLLGWNCHQGYHIAYLIIIGGQRQRQMAYGVLAAQAEVV